MAAKRESRIVALPPSEERYLLELRGVPARIEGAYGYSFLNRTSDPYSKGNQHQLNSVGLHVAAARLPQGFAGLPPWLRSGFEPLVSIGGDFDADYEPERSDHSERWGAAEFRWAMGVLARPQDR